MLHRAHWHDDGSEAGSYAESIAPPAHWALADVVAVVESGPKSVGSAENHHLATTSAYFGARLAELPPRIAACVDAIQARDLSTLGRESEADAISLHVIAMTAQPPTLYWKPGTLAIMHAVHGWRRAGLAAYWTIDAGANVHVICAQADAAEVATRLEALPEVQWTITNGPGPGVRVHLE